VEKHEEGIQTVIDVNAYAGNWPLRPLSVSTPEELHALLKAEGIGKALVSPIEGILYDEPQLANEKLCEALRDFPDLMPVAVLNPKLFNWQRNLDVCCEKYHVRALKLYPNYHQYDLTGDEASALFRAAGERNLPIIIQMRVQDVRAQSHLASAPDVRIAEAINAARAHPDTRFVIGSIRHGEAHGKADEIMDLPNVWIDISNVEYTDGLRLLIKRYGTKQLLFGTHAPFFVVRSAMLKLKEAELSEEEHAAITIDNARTVFGV